MTHEAEDLAVSNVKRQTVDGNEVLVALVAVLKARCADQFRRARRSDGVVGIRDQERRVFAAHEARGVEGFERVAFGADLEVLADVDEGRDIGIPWTQHA